jgi:L-aspartate oxidase
MRYFLEFDTSRLPEDECDVLVCGSGIGGLTCAIRLKELGLSPVILTRGIGNTYYSQGGIAAAVHPEDSADSHYEDTIRAGRFINDRRSLRILVDQGIERIGDLERWGVNFDRKQGAYETTTEGGHSFPRVLKVKDYTGREIYTKLLEKVKELRVPIIQGELQEILGEGKVEGCIYSRDGSLRFVRTGIIVLATGGAASMFRHTSNPLTVRGDGIGIAIRAGALIRNPEFIQFHPTVLKGTNLLISEAVRGEGARLIDCRGERFVDELQPRDVVARAIYEKLKEGCDVYLDMRPLVERGVDLGARFPTIMGFLKERGIDPSRDPVPVVPAAHYYIGGISVDEWGRTTVLGLYAVGECACTGVHGANRLASNSLLEGVVFGFRVAHRVFNDFQYLKAGASQFRNLPSVPTSSDHSFSFERIKELMWNSAGLERSKESLEKALYTVDGWIREVMGSPRNTKNRQILDILLVCGATLRGALFRQESRGVHFRSDYPYEKSSFRVDTLIQNILENL